MAFAGNDCQHSEGRRVKSISEEDLSEMRANGELIGGSVVVVTGEID